MLKPRSPCDEERRQTGRERVVEVQTRNTRVSRRLCAEVERQHVDVVLEPAESEVGQQRGRERVIHADREALVLHVRHAAQGDELRTAAGAERRRTVAHELADGCSGRTCWCRR